MTHLVTQLVVTEHALTLTSLEQTKWLNALSSYNAMLSKKAPEYVSLVNPLLALPSATGGVFLDDRIRRAIGGFLGTMLMDIFTNPVDCAAQWPTEKELSAALLSLAINQP